MTNLLGPVLIFVGLTGLAYGVYIFFFANRDKRTSRQKNLDAISAIRGDNKRPANPAKKPKAAKAAAKSKAH